MSALPGPTALEQLKGDAPHRLQADQPPGQGVVEGPLDPPRMLTGSKVEQCSSNGGHRNAPHDRAVVRGQEPGTVHSRVGASHSPPLRRANVARSAPSPRAWARDITLCSARRRIARSNSAFGMA